MVALDHYFAILETSRKWTVYGSSIIGQNSSQNSSFLSHKDITVNSDRTHCERYKTIGHALCNLLTSPGFMTHYRIRFSPQLKKAEIKHKVDVGVSLIRDQAQTNGSRLAKAVSRHIQKNKPEDDAKDTPRSCLHQRLQFLRSLIVRILFCLDQVGLDHVKEEFLCQPNYELSIVQFVSLMVRVTCESDNQLLLSEVDINDIAQALAELFDMMDLNGNHTIEFAEFLETCIHWGLSSGGGIESRQILDDPIAPFSFGPSSKIDSRATKKCLLYLDMLDLVLVFEPIARKLMIMDPDYLNVTRTALIGEKRATAFEYIHGDSKGIAHRLTAVAFARQIILYEGLLAGRFSEQSRIPVRVKLNFLRWMQNADLLIGAGCNGTVFAWDLDGNPVLSLKGHTGSISAMILVPDSYQLVTGSTDRSVRLRDLQFSSKRTNKFTYTGHNGAVTCLAVNNSRTEFISGSSTGELFVWSLTDSHVLHKIPGHSRSLAFISFVTDSPEFISADEAGNYRIWDSRLAFSNVQTLSVGTSGFNHCGTAICTKRDTRILIPADFDVFSYDQKSQQQSRRRKKEITNLTEDSIIFGEYLESSCLFVTATNRTVRFWSALTGCLKDQYENIMENADIAAICFDSNARKMIVGDNRGRIHIFNAMSGGIMKKLVSHNEEIIGLKYIVTQADRLVISLSKDGRLRTHDEAPLQNCPVRLDFRLEQIGIHDATVLAASSVLTMVAVGDCSGKVAVWNLNSSRIADTFLQEGSISGLEFLGAYPLLAVSNGTPFISVYALEPQIQHGSCILRINSLAADILSSVFVNNSRILYVSDAAGFVLGFDLNPLIDQGQLLPVNKRLGGERKNRLRISTMKQLISNAHTAALHGAPRTVKFQASGSIITNIGLIQDPLCLFALSFGPHLTVWSFTGQRLGRLGTLDICRRSKQRADWKFPVNTEKRLHHADNVAREVLQSIAFHKQHHSPVFDKLDRKRISQSSEGRTRTFITQKEALPNIQKLGANSVSCTILKRSRSELLPASVFSSDGETLTRDKRQEIRNLRTSSEQRNQNQTSVLYNGLSRVSSQYSLQAGSFQDDRGTSLKHRRQTPS